VYAFNVQTALAMAVAVDTSPRPVSGRRIIISVSVTMSVCLSARLHISKQRANFTMFPVNVAVARSSFDDYAVNSNVLPVLWMTSCFT